MSLKHNRATEIITRASSDFILREADTSSLITVTRAEVTEDMGHATIFVSVFPDDRKQSALDFLKRKQHDMAEYLKEHVRLRRIPRITFANEERGPTGTLDDVVQH